MASGRQPCAVVAPAQWQRTGAVPPTYTCAVVARLPVQSATVALPRPVERLRQPCHGCSSRPIFEAPWWGLHRRDINRGTPPWCRRHTRAPSWCDPQGITSPWRRPVNRAPVWRQLRGRVPPWCRHLQVRCHGATARIARHHGAAQTTLRRHGCNGQFASSAKKRK